MRISWVLGLHWGCKRALFWQSPKTQKSWWAALSCVVLHGGPSGKKLTSTQKCNFQKCVIQMYGLHDETLKTGCKIKFFSILSCRSMCSNQIFENLVHVKTWCKVPLMSQNLTQNQKFPNLPKLILEYSRVRFWLFFEVNGAQHSPLSFVWGPLRAKNQLQRKFITFKNILANGPHI